MSISIKFKYKAHFFKFWIIFRFILFSFEEIINYKTIRMQNGDTSNWNDTSKAPIQIVDR